MPTTAEAERPGAGSRWSSRPAPTRTALTKLRAPGRDASDLAEVLEDPAVGAFEVETVLDAPADTLRRRIARFCALGGPGDLALVYLSCHGVLDDRGRLYYATTDTDRELLAATAIPAAWLNEQLEDCRSRRQILVLDCCHSGAFAKGAKGEGELALRERFEGRGRVVLTGSRGTEYSFEHDQVVGDSVSSVFTGALVEGLRSGDADRDGDGLVTVGELYDYAYEVVRDQGGAADPDAVDLRRRGRPAGRHHEPPAARSSSRRRCRRTWSRCSRAPGPRVREGAVAELADLPGRPGPRPRADGARASSSAIAAEDIPSVAAAAARGR